ncbi:unnamed protein product [Dibothriocephalus latus]|uniref:alkaline phosphatase n=1 Tax=Dibothriocephalus latus TaxID=60516 RepID=A0A3P6T2I0_DIBLA|nr:unnamed protein product [Dibothriocephalus latus]
MVRPSVSISDEVLPIPAEEIPAAYWEADARMNFEESEKIMSDKAKDARKAKNVILFLGDGMGLPSIAAGRFYANKKLDGKPSKFSFENWDYNTVARTYDLETMVMLCVKKNLSTPPSPKCNGLLHYLTLAGTKTRTGMLGVSGAIKVKECVAYNDTVKTISILKAAAKAGKATGILTTARVTHASPAGAFGHSAFRDWESDKDVQKDCQTDCSCVDLAQQLALENLDVNVILGGGRAKFLPNTTKLATDENERLDGKDLTDMWLKAQLAKGRKAAYAGTIEAYKAVDTSKVDYFMGLLYPSHLPYVLHRTPGEPTLPELTEKAIQILQHNPNGFFLFVEGGRIDHGHHDNKAKHALTELVEMSEAVDKAVSMVNMEETLIIVTADHSHSFEIVGRPARFDSLLVKDKHYGPNALDKKGLLPLMYINGPGAPVNETRKDVNKMTDEETSGNDFLQQALVPIRWSTHGGDDVPVYATGPFSWMFHRTVDNTFIAQTMKYAMCVEPYTAEEHCSRSTSDTDGTATVHKPFFGAILAFLVLLFRP